MATRLAHAAATRRVEVGHADAGFTLRVYARDARDTAAVVEDVLARAATAAIGS